MSQIFTVESAKQLKAIAERFEEASLKLVPAAENFADTMKPEGIKVIDDNANGLIDVAQEQLAPLLREASESATRAYNATLNALRATGHDI